MNGVNSAHNTASDVFQDADLEMMIRDPHRFGVPTFEEFRKNPDKYKMPKDWLLQAISDQPGKSQIGHLVRKVVYRCLGFDCSTLEEVERVAANEGLHLTDLDIRPQMIQDLAGKYVVRVDFVRKGTPTPKELALE